MAAVTDSSRGEKPTWLLVIPWDLHHAGGVNQVVLSLYEHLGKRGQYRPLILIADWAVTAPQNETQYGCDVRRLRLRRAPPNARETLSWLLLGPAELLKLHRLLKQEHVAVINVHYPGLNSFPLALLKYLRLFTGSLLLSFHGLDVTAASHASGRLRRRYDFLVRQADRIAACSAALAGEVKKIFPRAADKVHVVHNGIDPDEASQDDAALPQAPALPDNYLLTVATYEHKKGQDVLLRAFSLIARHYSDLHLVMVGRDDGFKSDLLALADSLGIADRVVALDPLPHRKVVSLYRNARALVLPSRSEPFGLVILEAGLRGTPVIATRVGGIPEILQSSDYGTLVEPEDAPNLADAIVELLKDPANAARRARLLQARVRSHFTWDRACERLKSLAEDAGNPSPA